MPHHQDIDFIDINDINLMFLLNKMMSYQR